MTDLGYGSSNKNKIIRGKLNANNITIFLKVFTHWLGLCQWLVLTIYLLILGTQWGLSISPVAYPPAPANELTVLVCKQGTFIRTSLICSSRRQYLQRV